MAEPHATPYERTYTVTWADIDANRHMRNTAYSEYASHTRFAWLASHGFTLERLAELGVGPVVFRETTEYFRELHLDDTILVDLRLAGANGEATRWRIRHELFRLADDGTRVRSAALTLDGAWMDLRARKLTRPPETLAALLTALPHSEDFETLPSRR